jgi:hypothetical protein
MYPPSQYATASVDRVLARAASRGIAIRPWSQRLEPSDPFVHQPVLHLVDGDEAPPRGLGPLEDWVRQPAEADELEARVDRLLARARRLGPVHLSFDPDGLIRVDDRILILSPTEAELMAVLVPRLGEVVGREELVATVWPGQEANLRLLNRHLVNLRKRLQGVALAIHSVRGYGILLDKVAP